MDVSDGEGIYELYANYIGVTIDEYNVLASKEEYTEDEQETLFGIVNGSLALPQTIVLNRKGEVIYNKVGSVTPEALAQLYKEASGQ